LTAEPRLSPSQAVDQLVARYEEAVGALRGAVERFLHDGTPPSPQERLKFRYPPEAAPPSIARAFAKFSTPGVYSTTVTQPADFRRYLMEQLEPLVAEFGAEIDVSVGAQEIAYPYVFESGDELGRGGATAAELARYFPTPSLAVIGDEIADGQFDLRPGAERPLALYDAARIDYSLRRLVHYTGSDWRAMQPWVHALGP
jgi:AMP nucleosidase